MTIKHKLSFRYAVLLWISLFCFFVHKFPRNQDVNNQIQSTTGGQYQVEVIEVGPIEIIFQPFLSGSGRYSLHNGDSCTAHQTPHSHGADVQGGSNASHLFRHLVIEKLLHPNNGEDITKSSEDVLWEQPPYFHGKSSSWRIYEAVVHGNADPFGLYKSCNDHGKQRKEDTSAYPLKHCYARGVSSEFSSDWDEKLII